MSEPSSTATAVLEPAEATAEPEAATIAEEAVVEEDLLVEDISIDGMCGVY